MAIFNVMNILTDQEREKLKLLHKRERDKRVCDRIKAILLYDKGWSPQQIAEALLISDQAVRNYTEVTSKIGFGQRESSRSRSIVNASIL